MRKFFLTATLVAAATLLLSIPPFTSSAAPGPDTTASGATVTTDKTDYQPGETVVISGSGWTAGESVSLTLKEDPANHADTTLTATADEYGNLVNKDFQTTQEHLGTTFTLTAAGQSSGRTANATFTDGGAMNYSPNNQTLNIQTDSNPQSASFSQTVSAPRGNGNFAASLQVTGTGLTPLPTAWVSASPNPLSYSTGTGSPTVFFPQTRTVTVTVPPFTPAGTYTGQIKVNPSITGVGVGSGTNLSVVVTADNAPPNTLLSAAKADTSAYNGVDWTNQDVTITLSATDTGTPTTGVASTKYSVDGGPYQTYASPFTISSQGLHTVTYFSTDFQGNAEGGHTFTVKIDKTKPVITLNGDSDITITYGDSFTDPGASATDSGGSGLAGAVGVSGSVNTSVVADYVLSYNVSDNAGNAADTVTRTVHVVKADQTIIFGALADKTYGDPDFMVNATAGSGDAVSFSALGNCTVSGNTVHITGAGSCTITASEDGNANYNPAPDVAQSFNIARANATISVSGVTVTYDGAPHGATGTATGVQSEDLSGLLSLGASFTNVPGGTANWSFAGNSNYNADAGSVSIVINPKALTITASSPADITYGDAAPAVTPGYSGFIMGEGISNLTTQPTCGTIYSTGSNAGTYATTCSGASAQNYDISYVAGSLNVLKKLLTVTADNKSKVYDGLPYSPFTVQYSGFVLGQNQSVLGGSLTFSGSAVGAVSVGTYTITPGGLASNNYAFSYVNGTLTIQSWTLTGFYQPVDMSVSSVVVWNTVKGGSTVPLKFNIYAGGVEKTDIASVKSFAAGAVPCTAGLDDTVETAMLTTGGTTLRYDTTAKQFVQNWQTPKTGTCYMAVMTAQDGSTLKAFFKLK